MDEQSPEERQPKVRRGKAFSTEAPLPTGDGSTGSAEQDPLENISEKLAREAREDNGAHQAGVLEWQFQVIRHAIHEWTHFFDRTAERSSRAIEDLSACPSVANVLRWQRDLVQSSFEDWLKTSFVVFGASMRKVPHAKAYSKTAAT